MIFFNEEINSDSFFISTSISLIPSAVNFCNLNSNIASTCTTDKLYKPFEFLVSINAVSYTHLTLPTKA